MRIKKITPIEDFPMPRSGSAFAGAWDLHAAITEPVTIRPGEQALIGTGYAWEIPRGKVGLLLPRSGLGTRGAVLGNLVGVIDSDFRGEVAACIWNRNSVATDHSRQIGRDTYVPSFAPNRSAGITISPGERFCQLLIVETWMDELVIVDELSPTERGASGFGSSGAE